MICYGVRKHRKWCEDMKKPSVFATLMQQAKKKQ